MGFAAAPASAAASAEAPRGGFSNIFRNALRPSTFPAADPCHRSSEAVPEASLQLPRRRSVEDAPQTLGGLPNLLTGQRRGNVEGPNCVSLDMLHGQDKVQRSELLEKDGTPKFGSGPRGSPGKEVVTSDRSPERGGSAGSPRRGRLLPRPVLPFESAAAMFAGERVKA